MRITDRQIEAFRETVSQGSITLAAQSLHVTQPAVSRSLKGLEEEVGFQLLERRGRGIWPTKNGFNLYKEIMRAYVGKQAVVTRAEAIREGRFDVIRIVSMPAFADTVVASAIGSFQRKKPNIRVDLDVLNTVSIVEGVRQGRFDLGVANPVFDDPSFTWEVLHSENMVAVMSLDHPLSVLDAIDESQLVDHKFIGFPSDNPYQFQSSAIAVTGSSGQSLYPSTIVRTQMAACEMIASGYQEFAIVDPRIARKYGNGLSTKPLNFEIPSEVGICSLSGEKNDLVEEFVVHLKSTL